MVFIDFACQSISSFYVLLECDFYFFLIILPIELVRVPQEVAARVVTSIILIVILDTFIVEGSLHVNREFLIIYKRAGVRLNIILLTMILIVFRFLMKLVIYNQICIIYAVGIFTLSIY